MLNHNNSNSNDPMESSEKKNIDKIIKEDIKSMDILFPKYDKYYTNLNVLILYSYGMFLKLSEDESTIQLDKSLSMFFKKPYNENELNNLTEAIENSFNYFFSCLEEDNINDVKQKIIETYQKDAYYNLLTVKEHIHNTLIIIQKANIGLLNMNKFYKSYWSIEFNNVNLYNIQTNNARKLEILLSSEYLNTDITNISHENEPSYHGLENSGITYKYSSDEDDSEINYKYSSDGGDNSSMEFESYGPTYLTDNQNETYFIEPTVIDKQPILLNPIQHTNNNICEVFIDEDKAIENEEMYNYEEIDRGNSVDNCCQYVGDELHEYFNVEGTVSTESLDLDTKETNIGEDLNYLNFLNREVTEESERIRQEIENRRKQDKEKEKNHIHFLRRLKYLMYVVGNHTYCAWTYVKTKTVNTYNYVSSSISNWYYGSNSNNNNKAKAF